MKHLLIRKKNNNYLFSDNFIYNNFIYNNDDQNLKKHLESIFSFKDKQNKNTFSTIKDCDSGINLQICENLTKIILNPFNFDLNVDHRFTMTPRTKLELLMMRISSTIREKENWQIKYKDPETVKKWKSELIGNITEKQFDYIIAELKYYESISFALTTSSDNFTNHKPKIEMSGVDGVWQNDSINPKLRKELIQCFNVLEEAKKYGGDDTSMTNWHPESNNQVLDLIHPSLYCHENIDKLKLNQESKSKSRKNKIKLSIEPSYSLNMGEDAIYQWIPTDLKFDKSNNNNTITFDGPINNCDESVQNMQNTKLKNLLIVLIQEISFPLVNLIYKDCSTFKELIPFPDIHVYYQEYLKLASIYYPPRFIPYTGEDHGLFESRKEFKKRIGVGGINNSNDITKDINERDTNENENERDNEDEDEDDDINEEYNSQRQYKGFEINNFDYMNAMRHFYNIQCKPSISDEHSKLQVIIKMSTIFLTPEKPKYPGGQWHIEGTPNESIFASQICYLDSDNITESRLSFRTCVSTPMYEQNDDFTMAHCYGFDRDEALLNHLGSIETKPGRCIAFPNFYQHRVEPFQLLDPNRSGFRRIIVFFYVNPFKEIPSTNTLTTKNKNLFLQYLNCSHLILLPSVLINMIQDYVDDKFWTAEDAVNHRMKLMNERRIIKSTQKLEFERNFSLCEH